MKKSSSGSDESSSDSEPNKSEQDEKLIQQIEVAVEKKQKAIILQNVTISPNKPKTPIEQLETLHPSLKKIPIQMDMDLSESKYDVYLLRIPRTIDQNLLANQKLKLHKPCKIKLDKKYIFHSISAPPDPALVIFDDAKIINFKSNTIISEYIKEQVLPELKVPAKGTIELPDNLKNRHPLFGSNFDKKIQLSEVVEQKLEDAKTILKKSSKEKRKHKEKRKVAESEQSEEVIYNLLNSSKPNGSFKKPKLNSELSDDSAFSSSGSTTHVPNDKEFPKKGKSKTGFLNETVIVSYELLKDKSDIDLLKKEIFSEYETDNENPIKKKKKKRHQNVENSGLGEAAVPKKVGEDLKKECLTDYETDGERNHLLKKKKRHRSVHANENNELQILVQESDGVTVASKKKDVKKEIFTEYETDAEDNIMAIKKRKRSIGDVENNELSITANESTNEAVPPKKVRNDVKKELLTEYETDAENLMQNHGDVMSVKKKKHKRRESLKAEVQTEYESDAETLLNKNEDGMLKKKKQKRRDNLKAEVQTEYETDAEPLVENNELAPSAKKKHKRRSNVKAEVQTEYETDAETLLNKNEDGMSKKNKKKRRDNLKAEVQTEYETDAEPFIFNNDETKSMEKIPKPRDTAIDLTESEAEPYTQKIKKIKKEVLTEYETDVETMLKRKKKKKVMNEEITKLKSGKSQQLVNIKSEMQTEYETDVDTSSQTKKKKNATRTLSEENTLRKSLANSTLKTDLTYLPSFNADISLISPSVNDKAIKKLKVKQENADQDIDSQISEALNDLSSKFDNSKGKKKKNSLSKH